MDQKRFMKAKRALFEKYYSFLNDMQKKAVFSVNGPLLVLAGAGSGKTTVLVNRISHIIRYGNGYEAETMPVSDDEIEALENALELPREEMADILREYAVDPCPPWNVLAITFTNKAAREIKERLETTLGEEANDIWAGTFHSMCLRILRSYGDRLGYNKSALTVYDTDDTKRLIQSILKELDIEEKTLPPKDVMREISNYKNRLVTPEEAAEEATAAAERNDFSAAKIIRIYRIYQKRLMDANAVDFDDIISKTVELLKFDDEVREYYQKKFRYVCIDEYQDTNHAQFVLTSLLCGGYNNVMAVGDDDQSIYRFRGAVIENILNFDSEFPDVKLIKLEQNYRSTPEILGAANSVIRNNGGRKSKSLWTDRESGEKVTVKKLDNQTDEARFIVDTVMDKVISEARRYSDFAVLCRINAQSAPIETALTKSGIPYRMLCGMRFYERKEVKDIVCYLSVINNTDDDLRLKRIINEPKRKIGATTVGNVERIAAAEGVSMYEIMKKVRSYTALSSAAPQIERFVALIEKLREEANEISIAELTERVIIESGYRQMLIDMGESERDRLENAEQLISNAEEYEQNNPGSDLGSYLEEVALISDIDNYDTTADAVTVMTIHSAKGLEFPVVFVPGCEEGIFPGSRSIGNETELEEERRLAYVVITRAKDLLYMTHVRERLIFGQTQYNRVSRFIEEIDEEFKNEEVEEDFGHSYYSPFGRRGARARGEDFFSASGFNVRDDSGAAIRPAPVKTAPPKEPAELFSAGERVVHPKFGKGLILAATRLGGGADVMYEVAFDEVGTKKLMGNYAKLKRE